MGDSGIEYRIELLTAFWRELSDDLSGVNLQMWKERLRRKRETIQQTGVWRSETSPSWMGLSQETVVGAKSAWGKAYLSGKPSAFVGTIDPIHSAIRAYGLGFFWEWLHNSAIDSLFVWPSYSPSTFVNYEERLKKHCDLLTALGTPVDRDLFTSLKRFESRYRTSGTSVENLEELMVCEEGGEWRQMTAAEKADEATYSVPQTEPVFAELNEIFGRYRSSWLKMHNRRYITGRIEMDKIKAELSLEKSTSRSITQLGRASYSLANNWFAGDLNATAEFLRIDSTYKQSHFQLVGFNEATFVPALIERLVAFPIDHYSDENAFVNRAANWIVVAGRAPKVAQIWESLGRRPSLPAGDPITWPLVQSGIRTTGLAWDLLLDAIEATVTIRRRG